MKATRASILSLSEEQFLISKISVLRKQQIETLPDNKILHDFLSCVSPEEVLVAYHDSETGDRIAWEPSAGFELDLQDAFFDSADKLQKAYEAVRSCFFENFLDDNDYVELGSKPSVTEKINGHNNAEPAELSPRNVNDDAIDMLNTVDEEDAIDLLSKINDLDANTLAEQEDNLDADEFSNLAVEEDVISDSFDTDDQVVAEADHSEEVSQNSLEDSSSVMEPQHNAVEHSQTHDATESAENLPVVNEEIEPETGLAEEVEDSTEKSEPDSQPETESQAKTQTETEISEDAHQNLDQLAEQLLALGMDEDKIDSLLSAVRSGKAPMETVQATIEKLKAEME